MNKSPFIINDPIYLETEEADDAISYDALHSAK